MYNYNRLVKANDYNYTVNRLDISNVIRKMIY